MQILLVEDDLFFQKFYAAKIKEAGIDVIVADDGDDALQKLETLRPQLILLDLIMPKKDGFEVLQALSQPRKRIVKLIFYGLVGKIEQGGNISVGQMIFPA